MTSVNFSKAICRLIAASGFFAPAILWAQTQPPQAINQQDEVVNIVRGVGEGAESFKILRSGDKAEINRYVTKVYPLDYANPFEILPYLRTVAALEKGNVITAWVPQEDGSAMKWIQVNVPDFQIPSIDAAVAAYDVPGFVSIPGDIKYSYRTKHRSAVEVANFIRSTTLSPDGAILGDAETNTIYVQDSPSDFERVFAQIQFYDIPTPQIDLEVKMIELTEVDQTSLGLDWDAWKTSLSGSADFQSIITHLDPINAPDSTTHFRQFDGLLSIDATALARFLNYLVDRGKAEVRLQTNLTVSNGRTAELSSMTAVPGFQYVFNPVQGKSNLEETPAKPGDPNREGVFLAFTPDIAMESARLSLVMDVRSPVAIDKTGQPIFSDQIIEADLTLAQDQLYKVGGVRRGTTATQRKGIPLLKEIPVLKYLFSNETDVIRETDLYLFVEPSWTAPLLPRADSMKVNTVLMAEQVEDILHANPNLAMSPEDAEKLQEYFNAVK